MYRYVAAALIAVLLGFYGGWKVQNWRFTSKIATINAEHAKVREDMARQVQVAEASARRQETAWRNAADKERERHREQVRAIDKRLSVTLGELRQRPERSIPAAPDQVPHPPETCAGVSGAELARGDGEFLAWYAADARKQREALRTCEVQYEAVRAELNKE